MYKHIRRYGPKGKDKYGLIDNLELSYTAGQLTKIEELTGLQNPGTAVSYDAMGNMTANQNRGIHSMEYSPTNFMVKASSNKGEMKFSMTAGGAQLQRVTNKGTDIYAGPMTFQNGAASFFSHGDGRYVYETNQFQYAIHDHLGNVMVMFTDANNDGKIISEIEADITKPNEVFQRNYYYTFCPIKTRN